MSLKRCLCAVQRRREDEVIKVCTRHFFDQKNAVFHK